MKLAVFLSVLLAGCSAQQKSVETDIATLANSVCETMDTQPEPDWIRIICKVEEDANPGVVKLIQMRVKKKRDAGI